MLQTESPANQSPAFPDSGDRANRQTLQSQYSRTPAKCPENSPELCSLGYTSILAHKHRLFAVENCRKSLLSESSWGKSAESSALPQFLAHATAQKMPMPICPFPLFLQTGGVCPASRSHDSAWSLLYSSDSHVYNPSQQDLVLIQKQLAA